MADERTVPELLAELDEVRAQLQQLREDLGVVARSLLPGKRIEAPRRNMTPEAIEELQTLERREEELYQTYKRKVGMP